MRDIVSCLRNIADASRRADGSDIPLGEQCREAAGEIERLQVENRVLRACFNAASLGMDFKKVGAIIADAKEYVARMRQPD